MKPFNDQTRWAQRLIRYRQRSGLSLSALARAVGVTISYISKLEKEKTPPPEHQRNALAKALGLTDEETLDFHVQAELERADPVTVKYLRRWMEFVAPDSDFSIRQSASADCDSGQLPVKELHNIPIINKAAAGHPQDFTDMDYPVGIADSYIAVPDITDPNAFGFYVSGDSMEPDFPDGTLLIASPNTAVFESDPCFVRFSSVSRVSGCSFKRIYFMEGGRVKLVPINRRYTEELFDSQELTGIWPAIRSYGKINRNLTRPARRKNKKSGETSEPVVNRSSSAAG